MIEKTVISSILTGIKPSGDLHIGNYVGAIKPMLDLFEKTERSFLFVANAHSLNGLPPLGNIKKQTIQQVASYIALGVDPEKTHIYLQSDIPEVFELNTILSAVTPKSWMNKAHAYKDSVSKNIENKKDVDENVNMGLYTYPILMASDILAIGASHIPVGEDQIQHIEITRDIADRFNHYVQRDILATPEYITTENQNTIVGIDGRKMSKSYNNVIPLMTSIEERTKAVMKITTDSKGIDDPKDIENSTIFKILDCFPQSSRHNIEEFKNNFAVGGIGYGQAKQILADTLNEYFNTAFERYQKLMQNSDEIERILADGSTAVRKIAREKLIKIKENIY